MKAITIVELPDDADLTKCRANINIEKVRDCGYDFEPYTFRLYCPLRPLPQKLDANDWHRMFSGEHAIREAKGYGYNACLEEITGETE